MFSLRHRLATLAGFAVAAVLLCSTLFFHGGSLRTFWDETMGYQLDRVTPLSIWTLPAYHPGWPDIGWLQQAAQVAVALGLLLLAVLPRGRKDAAAVAALAGGRDAGHPDGVQLLVLPVRLLVAAAGAARAAAAAGERRPGAHGSDSRSLNVSIEVARPSAPHSITAPSIRTSPSAGSKRDGQAGA